MIAALLGVVAVGFATAYFLYGRRLDRWLGVEPDRPTPAASQPDGVDYVPTAAPVVFGHHFSSIAGAGPIVGPIIAGAAFGWLPALIWIVLGTIFIGGVHDYGALIASLRHQGRSIGEICRTRLTPFVYYLFLVFVWFALIYVMTVFLDLVALGFAPADPALAMQGGATATASLLYLMIALAFGWVIYRLKARVGPASVIFVPLVFLALVAGLRYPLLPDRIPAFLGSAKNTWCIVLLLYCFLAAVSPVWLLLQPRDYLSSFLLFACVAGGLVGAVVAGAAGLAPVRYPMFVTWNDGKLGLIFPALFTTVACGAVSGFHSLVASGTTSKQLARESSARGVAYGAMFVEGLLAALALSTVMILRAKPQESPQAVFARGLGTFLSPLGVSPEAATAFGLLAITSFVLTTLDTCTRLARFILQEIFRWWTPLARYVTTLAALLLPGWLVFTRIPGPGGQPMPAWQAIWPAFGTTNQLLAALTLLIVLVWLKSEGRKALFAAVPMVFMVVMTLTSLTQFVWLHLARRGSRLLGWLSAGLLALALLMIFNAVLVLLRGRLGRAARVPSRPTEGSAGQA